MIRNRDWVVTVSRAVLVTPLYVAEMVAVPEPEELIATLKAPVELFAGIVTEAGTVARDGLLLDSVTVAPPEGVSPENTSVADVCTVPVCTVDGLNVIASRVVVLSEGGGVTVMVAVRVTPAYVADTTDVAVEVTGLVETDTAELVAPAATVAVAGTVTAAVLLLVRETTAPPDGAGAVSVTVPDALPPPWRVDGLSVIEASVAVLSAGGGVTVMVAVRVTPAYVADTTDVAVEVTGLVETDTAELVAPAATVAVAGTVTAAVLLLDKETTAPPDGAAAVSVTVAEAAVPPCTVEGLRLTELSAADAGGGGVVATVHPDNRALVGVAEPSLTSTVQSAGLV